MKYFFPKVKTKTFQTHTHKKERRTTKISKKDDTKTRHRQMIFYGKKVIVVIFGISTLLSILVLGVGLKLRPKGFELEADIWGAGSTHADHHSVRSNSNKVGASQRLYLTLLSHR